MIYNGYRKPVLLSTVFLRFFLKIRYFAQVGKNKMQLTLFREREAPEVGQETVAKRKRKQLERTRITQKRLLF